jgi:hypothetical protein
MTGRFLAALAAACCLATTVQAQSIGGNYVIDGTNIDGSKYGGRAEITLTSNTTCEIVWVTGSTQSSGICSRNGDAFAAAYELNGDVGLAIYRLQANGVLNGVWTIAGQDGVGKEILVPR